MGDCKCFSCGGVFYKASLGNPTATQLRCLYCGGYFLIDIPAPYDNTAKGN